MPNKKDQDLPEAANQKEIEKRLKEILGPNAEESTHEEAELSRKGEPAVVPAVPATTPSAPELSTAPEAPNPISESAPATAAVEPEVTTDTPVPDKEPEEDPETEEAVDEIAREESDEVLAAEDKEIKEAFESTMKVRVLSPEAEKLADDYFFETLVRLHRSGEGMAYTGVKPAGTPVDKKILAADKSLALGDLGPLKDLVPKSKFAELKKRFDILVYDRQHKPWMLIECKEPKVSLSEDVLQQVLRYNISVPVEYIVITNGTTTVGWRKESELRVLNLLSVKLISGYIRS